MWDPLRVEPLVLSFAPVSLRDQLNTGGFLDEAPIPKKTHVRSGRSTPMKFPYNRGWSSTH